MRLFSFYPQASDAGETHRLVTATVQTEAKQRHTVILLSDLIMTSMRSTIWNMDVIALYSEHTQDFVTY
jgi:hypothetical protein